MARRAAADVVARAPGRAAKKKEGTAARQPAAALRAVGRAATPPAVEARHAAVQANGDVSAASVLEALLIATIMYL